MTPVRMFHAGMFAAPFQFGLRDLRAFAAFVGHTDKVHREVIPERHYYLLTLGVSPRLQRQGAGGSLLRQMLQRADRERMPTYLETQRPENVPIYERFGYKIANNAAIPSVALQNWGMIRRPT